MNKKVKLVLGAGMTLSLIGSTPLFANAAGTGSSPSDYVANDTRAIRPLYTNPNEAIFSGGDPARKNYYSSITLKKLDKNAGNRLFLVSDHGYIYWSPIRPGTISSGGVSNGMYGYENFYTATMYDNGSSRSDWLRHLWEPDPSLTQNFKSKQMIQSDLLNKRTYSDMATVGKAVQNSSYVNHGGPFNGQSGTWRFNGYAKDGSSSQDVLFPDDYSFEGLTSVDWDNYSDYGNRLFNQTIFDTAKYADAKKTLIKRLMEQYPAMKIKTWKQWMSILSLQTAPEIDPQTGQADGTYGGATFMAYQNNGTKYRGFLLTNNEKTQGSMNLDLSKLVITEATPDANGNYPVVATISRSKEETRDYVDKQVMGNLVPGRTYRVISTVENVSKITSTKHNPTTTDVGYAVNYNGNKIETDGVYNPQYDKADIKATQPGTIGPGKSDTTVTTFTMPSNLKAGSKVRFGSVIDNAHFVAGDNLNSVDDDLMLVVPVATGNIQATNVTLVDEHGREVAEPLPGHQYKVRYTFKYNGPTMRYYEQWVLKGKKYGQWRDIPTGVTVNYQNTRLLPDGTQEAIMYQPNSTKQDTSVTHNLVLVNGQSYSFDTQAYQWYEIPYISTQAVVSTDSGGLNTNSGDDSFRKTWNEEYDYSIDNLQVVARTERASDTTDGKQTFGVSFTVNNTMPLAAQKDNYAKDVNIRVNVNGQVKIIKEHITAGKNKNIVTDVTLDHPIKASSNESRNVVNAKVDVNYDRAAYESGSPGMSNDTATTKVTLSKLLRDSKTGSLTNPTNNSTNTGGYVDAPIDPTKGTPSKNDSNTWNQKYTIESWKAQPITYKGMNNSKTFTFYRYTPNPTITKTVKQREDYNVTDVLFQSKETVDNKWGQKKDGWVSLLTDSGHAQVRAGYGYQIKMIVTYSTNAFSTQPLLGSNMSIRPFNVAPNIPKDAYFETPDGKILSASGIDGTNRNLVAKVVTQTPGKVVVEYTLAPTQTMGISTPGRIYVSENTPNGVYKVQAWTPTINGVPTKNLFLDSMGLTLFQPSPLSDVVGSTVSTKPMAIPASGKDSNGNIIIDTNSVPSMSFIVVGSNKDDLVNSVVQ